MTAAVGGSSVTATAAGQPAAGEAAGQPAAAATGRRPAAAPSAGQPEAAAEGGRPEPAASLAIVLAGGGSRRMGARKELLDIGGEPALLRQVRLLSEVAAGVTVATDARQAYPFLPPDVRIVRDREPDGGPIAGICAGMGGSGAELIIVVGCDYPLAGAGLWRRLLAAVAADPALDAAMPAEAGGRLHPLCAVYRRRTLPLWERGLAGRELKVMAVAQSLRTTVVPCGESDELFNMNTPDDYRLAKERLR